MNSTMMSGYGGYYGGGSFIDVMFRHIMEKGISTLTAGMVVQLLIQMYAYMSIEKLQMLLNKANGKLYEWIKSNPIKIYRQTTKFEKIKGN